MARTISWYMRAIRQISPPSIDVRYFAEYEASLRAEMKEFLRIKLEAGHPASEDTFVRQQTWHLFVAARLWGSRYKGWLEPTLIPAIYCFSLIGLIYFGAMSQVVMMLLPLRLALNPSLPPGMLAQVAQTLVGPPATPLLVLAVMNLGALLARKAMGTDADDWIAAKAIRG